MAPYKSWAVKEEGNITGPNADYYWLGVQVPSRKMNRDRGDSNEEVRRACEALTNYHVVDVEDNESCALHAHVGCRLGRNTRPQNLRVPNSAGEVWFRTAAVKRMMQFLSFFEPTLDAIHHSRRHSPNVAKGL